MTQAPPVSVVMPVHNGMPFIDDSIASIVTQSFGDFELVVGDDGSSDGTSERLRDWERRDPRIRALRREGKSGLAASGNWVVSMARAPLVAIAHADDISHPDRLARQVALLDAHPDVAAVGTLAQGIDASGRKALPPSYWRLIWRSAFAPFSHSSIMMRRASFDLAGGYRAEAEYWEDLDLYWRLLRTGRILVLPEALTSYRYSPVSDRSRSTADKVEDSLEIMYGAAALAWEGRNIGPLIAKAGGPPPTGKIRPRIFIARCWTDVWSGRRPQVMRRLIARGDLRWNLGTLTALVFVASAQLSPKGARAIVRMLTHVRNLVARRILGDRPYVEWQPWRAAPAESAPAAAPVAQPAKLPFARQG